MPDITEAIGLLYARSPHPRLLFACLLHMREACVWGKDSVARTSAL